MEFRLNIIRCSRFQEIRNALEAGLETYGDLLPEDKEGLILLKPNLNSNMNALTGNTTDLRILSGLILALKAKGYGNIVIGEGTNSGFYRNNISVISRLGVDRLARYHGVKVVDLNQSQGVEIPFDNGATALVAREVMEAQLLINLPKLKTHFENGMTVCMKNLMGCLVGQENKKKVHDNLAENILRLNEAVRPQLHIVDALIAMEGLGPTKGVPLRMDRMIMGTDPCLIDLLCAHMACFDHKKVRTLALAQAKGRLPQGYFDAVRDLASRDRQWCQKKFAPPKAGFLATFIHSPKRQKFFLKIRNTPFFTYLAGTDWFGKLLYLTDLRQDVFLFKEMVFKRVSVDTAACDHCGICKDVCPLGLELPGELERGGNRKSGGKSHGKASPCIGCLYCYAACPKKAIEFEGEMGFFEEQVKQYDQTIRTLYKKK